jgi:hypothetical protein
MQFVMFLRLIILLVFASTLVAVTSRNVRATSYVTENGLQNVIATPTAACTPPLIQNFDDVTTLPNSGWTQINHSQPIGAGVWAQGNPDAYPAQSGAPNAYATVGFESGINVATLSNWLIMPAVRLQNGDSITFWTRTVTNVNFPDRLQVRLSVNGDSTNVGTTSTDVGDFSTLLLDINPTYLAGGDGSYPTDWTQYTVIVNGAPSPVLGRFAFRYFVENGGPGGNNSDGIGLDTVSVDSCLTPVSMGGTVTYGNAIGAPSPRYVSNVAVTGQGSVYVHATTDFPGGNYLLTGFMGGPYTVIPSKTGGVNAISSFDAARIAQHVAGPPLPALQGNQLIVADVSGNGVISSFDAGQVARYVAGIPGSGSSATWRFLPAERNYASVSSTISGENYSALLMGEVSGNWTNSGARASGRRLKSLAEDNDQADIVVSLPASTTATEKEVIIPVAVQGAANNGIISYEFDLEYDPTIIQPQSQAVVLAGTVSSGLSAVVNATVPGVIRVVVYGPLPIYADGVLLNLRFTPVGKPCEISPLKIDKMVFNDGDPTVEVLNGGVALSCATQTAGE